MSLTHGSRGKKRPHTTGHLPSTFAPVHESSGGKPRPQTSAKDARNLPGAGLKPAHLVPRTISSLGHYRIPVHRRNGSESFVMIPRIPQNIWFAGTGTNRADWSSVPGATIGWLAQLQVSPLVPIPRGPSNRQA